MRSWPVELLSRGQVWSCILQEEERGLHIFKAPVFPTNMLACIPGVRGHWETYPLAVQAEVTPVGGFDPHVGLNAILFRSERPWESAKMSLTDQSHWLSSQANQRGFTESTVVRYSGESGVCGCQPWLADEETLCAQPPRLWFRPSERAHWLRQATGSI